MSQFVGSSISGELVKQLKIRQGVFKKSVKTAENLKYISSKSAWIKLTSSVDKVDEKEMKAALTDRAKRKLIGATSDLAKNYVLTNAAGKEGISFDKDVKKAYNKSSSTGFRPFPGITSLDVKSKNTYGTLLEAVIKFKVFSKEDLESIELLYFRPGYTALLEYGWNLYYNNDETPKLIRSGISNTVSNFFDGSTFRTIDDKVEAIRKDSDGNYNGMFGYITNFNWSLENDGTYDCEVKLLSRGAVLESIKSGKTTDWIPSSEIKEKENEDELDEQQSIWHYLLSRCSTSALTDKQKGDKFEIKKLLIEDNGKPKDNPATTLSNKIKDNDYVFGMSHETKGDGGMFSSDPDSTVVFYQLSTILKLYNNLIALSDPTKDGADILFKVDTEHKHRLNLGSFSLDPTVAVWSEPPIGIFKEAKLRPKNSKDFHNVVKNNMNDLPGGTQNTCSFLVNEIFLKELATRMSSGNIDSGIGMLDFLKEILKGINNSFGNVIQLDVQYHHEGPYCGHYTIVDRKGYKVANPEVISVNGLSTTVSNINVSSKIPSNMASMIAIASQGNSGNSQDDLANIQRWNLGALDRHMVVKEQGDSKTNEECTEDLADKRKKFIEEFIEMYDKFNNKNNAAFEPSDVDKHRLNATAELVEMHKEDKPGLGGNVPVELSLTLDGIQGFIVGSAFKINRGIVPDKYVDDYAYIITGVENSIGADNKWVTDISTQFYPIK